MLVIDDDPSMALIARDVFANASIEVLTAANSESGVELVRARRPDVVVLDHYLPDGDGLHAFQRIREFDARLPVIWVTACNRSDTAIAATRLGAFDYLTKPVDFDKLRHQVLQAIESRQLMLVPVEIGSEATPDSEADVLIGRSAAMQDVYKAIGRIAAHEVPALLVGETGTGKELVARAIYQHSPRHTRQFLRVRSSDFSPAELERELFGSAGDATGLPDRHGRIDQAAGGMLLLEEIGAIAPATQGKLLRLIREGVFERPGAGRTVTVDVTLLFTSQHDPEQLVRSERLRSDLYYLLRAFAVRLPPLRERREDLPLLVEHFIHRQANIRKSFDAGVVRVSSEAMRLLESYAWPGNITELEAVLRRALIETKGTVLASDYLCQALGTRNDASPIEPATALSDISSFAQERLAAGSTCIYDEALERMERELLSAILAHTGGNQAQAARLLGMTRTSLRKKIHLLGIPLDRRATV